MTQLRAPLVGWFHLGREETANARAFLRLCNGEDSVDELGFGIIRDGFSDQFFPGTNTVMTQARYLIFVAAINRYMEIALEKRKGAIHDPHERSRRMQDQLRDVLKETVGGVMGKGVIGISVDEPERYPSTIYWGALRTLRILRFDDGAESDYLRTLRRYHEAMRADENGGDAVAEVDAPPLNWDRRIDELLPLAFKNKGRFKDGLGFDLEPLEAKYLHDCYLGEDRATRPASEIADSLLAYLIDRRHKQEFAFPWEVTAPSHLEVAVDDARRFSLLARGATLQYYHWLISGRKEHGWEAPDSDLDGWLKRWWEEGRPILLSWNIEAFLTRRLKDLRINRRDAGFLVDWIAKLKAIKSRSAFLANTECRSLIIERELTCKRGKARLKHPEYLRTWKRPPTETDSPYQLNFRAPIGNRFVQSIVDGLERGTKLRRSRQ